jgi:hypothetical protein
MVLVRFVERVILPQESPAARHSPVCRRHSPESRGGGPSVTVC